jgi:dephospho-CoA kinase
MTKVVGLIGRIASGKTIVSEYLVSEKGARYYRFSDVLKDLLLRVHKPNNRENLQNIGLAIRKVFGDGILAQALREDIAADKSGLIVVDGIRYQDEFDMVKGLGGIVIFVTAPQRMRYERVIKRATRGEARISLEEFQRSEEKETERFIDLLGSKADIIIENTGSIADLKKRVESAVGPI